MTSPVKNLISNFSIEFVVYHKGVLRVIIDTKVIFLHKASLQITYKLHTNIKTWTLGLLYHKIR